MENSTIWLFMTFLIPAIVGFILLLLDNKFSKEQVKN